MEQQPLHLEEYSRLVELLHKQRWVQSFHSRPEEGGALEVMCLDDRVWMIEQPRHFVWLKYRYDRPPELLADIS